MLRIISRIRRHLADPESDHRKIVTGLFWVGLFVFVGKLAGAAKEMTIAWRYGISETVDAYALVLNLVSWPVSVWFSVLTVVLVPLVAHIKNDSPSELPRFRGELLGLTLIIGVGLGFAAWFWLPSLLRAEWLRLSEKVVAESLKMSSGLVLLAPMGAVISLFSAWMLACGRHRNTLFEAIPALTILATLLLPPGSLPEPLLWGTVAGFALHMTALAAPLRDRGELQMPSLGFTSPEWQGFWNNVGIMAIGQVLMSFTSIIDQFFAAGLGPGALSTLSYSNRILALILGMGAMAIGRATLPVFSAANAQSGADVSALAIRWAKWMFLIGIGVVSSGVVFAPWVVGLLFERGAFTATDTIQVSIVFQYALIQVPFYAFSLTLMNLLASQKKYNVLLLSGMVGIGAKILATAVLVPVMQVEGLVLSASIVYSTNAMLFYYFTSKAMK
jgi:peptidoglycan biosynthesis protein MviN/MurJ (putative lipid II flippase)